MMFNLFNSQVATLFPFQLTTGYHLHLDYKNSCNLKVYFSVIQWTDGAKVVQVIEASQCE